MPKSKPAPAEDAEPAEVSRINDVGLAFDPDPYMARGDCRDAMLNVLRTSMDWAKLSEQQQRDINAQIDQTAETIIAKLVKAISAEGRDAVRAKVEQLTVKDGLKLQLTALHDHDTVVMLGDLVGKYVSLIAADTGEHDGQRGDAQLDRDQADLLPDTDNSDLVGAADPPEGGEVVEDVTIRDDGVVRTGDMLEQGMARVDLKTSMIQCSKGNQPWTDIRPATPDELAAEREGTADFVDA